LETVAAEILEETVAETRRKQLTRLQVEYK
jgi:hypothetical protein